MLSSRNEMSGVPFNSREVRAFNPKSNTAIIKGVTGKKEHLQTADDIIGRNFIGISLNNQFKGPRMNPPLGIISQG